MYLMNICVCIYIYIYIYILYTVVNYELVRKKENLMS